MSTGWSRKKREKKKKIICFISCFNIAILKKINNISTVGNVLRLVSMILQPWKAIVVIIERSYNCTICQKVDIHLKAQGKINKTCT